MLSPSNVSVSPFGIKAPKLCPPLPIHSTVKVSAGTSSPKFFVISEPRIEISKGYRGDRYLVIIEEYIEGSSLSEYLKKGIFKPTEAVHIVRNLCCILNELHTLECPIIHRDIKPSNVMLTKSGEVVLLDMNVAKWYDSEEKEDTRLLGTKDYAAPEQVGYGMKASSNKTDIYAVGILLNVMLTGKFPKEKPAQGKLWNVIERCISLDANSRYRADELIERLDNYLGENTNAGKKDR